MAPAGNKSLRLLRASHVKYKYPPTYCDEDATSMVDLLKGVCLSQFLSGNVLHALVHAYHRLVVLRSFLIFSSRHNEISILFHVITRSKISFHVHASNVDHAITCRKGSFRAITSNKSANHASRQIAWGATVIAEYGILVLLLTSFLHRFQRGKSKF